MAQQEAPDAYGSAGMTPESGETEPTTSETASTEATEEETDFDDEDAWPIEMLIG